MDFIESANIVEKQTLIIDMASDYVTVTYIGDISMEKHFVWNKLEITCGGGSLTSQLLTIDQLKNKIDDLTLGDTNKYPAIVEYLKYK